MRAMDLARTACLGAVVGYSLFEAITLARAGSHAKRRKVAAPSPPEDVRSSIIVLVPGLNETAYARRTVEAWRGVLAQTSTVSRVVFVTSIRDSEKPSTRATLTKLIEGEPRFVILHDQRAFGSKSSQLNWAVEQCLKEGIKPTDAFGVFDFDSIPEDGLLDEVATLFQGDVDAVQAPVLNLAMLNRPRGFWNSSALATDATLQIIRSLGLEPQRIRRSKHPTTYLVGAGLFLRQACLESAGGFPEVDDITLGYRLSIARASIRSTTRFNVVDASGSLRSTMNSMVFIGKGVMSWGAEVRDRKDLFSRRHLRLVWLGLGDTFEMTIYPWMALALTVDALVHRRRFSAAMLGPFWLIPPLATAYLPNTRVVRDFSELPCTPLGARLLLSPARRIFRTLGPLTYILRVAQAQTLGGSPVFTKSNRVAR